jgi:hypothetical protein
MRLGYLPRSFRVSRILQRCRRTVEQRSYRGRSPVRVARTAEDVSGLRLPSLLGGIAGHAKCDVLLCAG